jgi:hypothetical protein
MRSMRRAKKARAGCEEVSSGVVDHHYEATDDEEDVYARDAVEPDAEMSAIADVKQCGGVTKHDHLGGEGAEHLNEAISRVSGWTLLQMAHARAGLGRECGGVSGHR